MLIDSLCSPTVLPDKASDEAVKALVTLFRLNDKTLLLIRKVIRVEVDSSVEYATSANSSVLFRSNDLASRVVTSYITQGGGSYLRLTLTATLETILAKSAKMNPTTGKAADKDAFVRAVQELVKNITDSVETCPGPVRSALSYVESLCGRSPVKTLFFLRYLCPGIVSPVPSGLVEEKAFNKAGANGQMVFLQVARALQQLASGTVPPQFPELAPQKDALDAFLGNLLDVPPADLPALETLKPLSVALEVAEDTALITLYDLLMEHKDAISKHLVGIGEAKSWAALDKALKAMHFTATQRRRGPGGHSRPALTKGTFGLANASSGANANANALPRHHSSTAASASTSAPAHEGDEENTPANSGRSGSKSEKKSGSKHQRKKSGSKHSKGPKKGGSKHSRGPRKKSSRRSPRKTRSGSKGKGSSHHSNPGVVRV